jgi:probable biosynthetic protein (TIGR04098 family)
MVLFGNAHSHALVMHTDVTPGEIVDGNGDVLYPAYFYTSLRVPLNNLLRDFKLWDMVDVGVSVKRFGDTLLESNCVLAHEGNIDDDISQWNDSDLPTMYGNNLIVVDAVEGLAAKRKVSNPEPECIAELPKVGKAPPGILKSRKMRSSNFEEIFDTTNFSNKNPISHTILDGRDTNDGHAMIFAKFAEIMDIAERRYFSSELLHPIPDEILSKISVLERDIYYYGNCYAREVLNIRLNGNFEKISEEEDFSDLDYIPAAYINLCFEITQKRDNTLIAMSKVKKIIAIPMKDQELMLDIYRILNQFNEGGLS